MLCIFVVVGIVLCLFVVILFPFVVILSLFVVNLCLFVVTMCLLVVVLSLFVVILCLSVALCLFVVVLCPLCFFFFFHLFAVPLHPRLLQAKSPVLSSYPRSQYHSQVAWMRPQVTNDDQMCSVHDS